MSNPAPSFNTEAGTSPGSATAAPASLPASAGTPPAAPAGTPRLRRSARISAADINSSVGVAASSRHNPSREETALPQQQDTLHVVHSSSTQYAGNDPASVFCRGQAKSSLPSAATKSEYSAKSRGHRLQPLQAASSIVAGFREYLVLSLLSRFFIIFVMVAGLMTAFWSWNIPPARHKLQISQINEPLIRNSLETMQLQLELVDAKVDKKLSGLKKELEDRIVEQNDFFEAGLQNIQAKSKSMEDSLKRLTEKGFPARQDVLNLIKSVVNERAAEGAGNALSLDDVRTVARRLVETELEKHAADGIGKVDFALASAGGKVMDHSEGFYHNLGTGWRYLAGNLLPGASCKHPLANKILEPSFGEPGQCLPLKGRNTYVEIALRTPIFPDAFSLEHVSRSVAYDLSSAPKDFRVFGWLDTYKEHRTVESVARVFLGEFLYDVTKKNVQIFSVPQDLRGRLVNMVRLEVFSNYGSPSYTCIYRFRVHGTDPRVQPAILS